LGSSGIGRLANLVNFAGVLWGFGDRGGTFGWEALGSAA